MTDWTKADSDQFQNYLNKSNYKLIARIKDFIPKIEGKTIESAALEGAKKQGAEDIIDELMSLSELKHPQVREQPNMDVSSDIP